MILEYISLGLSNRVKIEVGEWFESRCEFEQGLFLKKIVQRAAHFDEAESIKVPVQFVNSIQNFYSEIPDSCLGLYLNLQDQDLQTIAHITEIKHESTTTIEILDDFRE